MENKFIYLTGYEVLKGYLKVLKFDWFVNVYLNDKFIFDNALPSFLFTLYHSSIVIIYLESVIWFQLSISNFGDVKTDPFNPHTRS